MISKKTLKDYEFLTIEDYYNYIVESLINGNIKQTKDLIKYLSKNQKIEFIDLLDSYKNLLENKDYKDLIKWCI